MATMQPMAEPFRISVRIERGKVLVSPDPAIVEEGKPFQWQFNVYALPSLTIEIYFSDGTPTGWTTEIAEYFQMGKGVRARTPFIAAVAGDPGDYKYGISATLHDTKEVVADDDPYLIVRPRQ
jgi:hypothetical protein